MCPAWEGIVAATRPGRGGDDGPFGGLPRAEEEAPVLP